LFTRTALCPTNIADERLSEQVKYWHKIQEERSKLIGEVFLLDYDIADDGQQVQGIVYALSKVDVAEAELEMRVRSA
jgi:hypothetical protein